MKHWSGRSPPSGTSVRRSTACPIRNPAGKPMPVSRPCWRNTTRQRTAPPAGRILHLRPAALLSIAASLLLLVFAMGWYFGSNDDAEERLAATRTLMLELMQDKSSSTRMRAATVSLDVAVADPEVIAHLGKMLRTDENTNVRLAALDALGRFAADPRSAAGNARTPWEQTPRPPCVCSCSKRSSG